LKREFKVPSRYCCPQYLAYDIITIHVYSLCTMLTTTSSSLMEIPLSGTWGIEENVENAKLYRYVLVPWPCCTVVLILKTQILTKSPIISLFNFYCDTFSRMPSQHYNIYTINISFILIWCAYWWNINFLE
jgi:hypothetical protein